MTKNELNIIKDVFKTEKEVAAAIKEFEDGTPLAYIIGQWYFYGLTFKLNPYCLIPRADTEHIVDKAIQLIPKNGVFADLCSGSGCIGISVLKHRPDLTCDAVEISPQATAIATKNAEDNGVGDRFSIICGDIFTDKIPHAAYDVIVCNPPYIPTRVIETLDERVQKEPRSALNGGEDGTKFYRYILQNYGVALKEGGLFIFEIGYDQKDALCELASIHGYRNSEFSKDYGGNYRVAVIY